MLRVRNAETRLYYAEDGLNDIIAERIRKNEKALMEYREALKTALSGRFAAAAASFSGTRKELNEAMRLSIRERKASLDTLIRETEALSPLAVLSRGYSVTTDADGRIIRNRGDATPGQEIVTRLMDGELRSIVKEG